MAVSASFHRNVYLLSQIIPPSDEFKKHFREGMFDKPNTTGFLHTSHYLLTIYDLERFHKLVQWPVICKKTEAKYRNNVKDYLTIIATENPDIGFPTILVSHLIHAGGSKFTIIMWKLSQVVVRKCIPRESTYSILFAPHTKTEENLGKKYLQEMTARINCKALCSYQNLSEMKETTATFLEEEKEALDVIRTEIFEKEKLVTTLSDKAPVHDAVKKLLKDVNDAEVIELWKNNVDKGISYIDEKNKIISDLTELSNKINNLIPGNSNETSILDAKQLPKVNHFEVSELFPFMQCLPFQLHKDDELMLHNLILMLNLLLTQLHQRLNLNSLESFSECLLQVKASCSDLEIALGIFQTHLSNIRQMIETQNDLCQKNIARVGDEIMPILNDIFLISSPVIKIDTDCGNIDNDLQKQLEFTPVEAAHKSLFSRYERLKQDHTPHGSKLRENFLVCRINFDDTNSTINNERQYLHSRAITPKRNLFFKQSEKYSQLFSTRIRRNRAANASIMSLPYSSKANSTVITNAPEELHTISELSLSISERSLYNNSMEFATPEKLSLKPENKSDNTSETDDVFSALPNEPIMLDICKTMEIEITNGDRITETGQTKQRRRSIGDLVKRYKNILERSTRTKS